MTKTKDQYFQNKVAVVTGGTQGIGLAVCKELVKRGCHVAVLARDEKHGAVALAELTSLRSNPLQKIKFYSVDVSSAEQVSGVGQQILAEMGTPFFLVNNAGRAIAGYIENLSIEAFQNMMDLNYFGIVHVCKTFVPHMIKEKRGHIVNVSSMAGFLGLFGYTGYCASKYAVLGFSEALSNELEPYKIAVSVLCPPNTRTPGLVEENRTKPLEVLKTEEKAKVLDPEQVAKALISKLPSRKFLIVPSFDGQFAHLLKRLSPLLIKPFIRRPYPKNV